MSENKKMISARLNSETIHKLERLAVHFNENSLGNVSRSTILEYVITDFYDKYFEGEKDE